VLYALNHCFFVIFQTVAISLKSLHFVIIYLKSDKCLFISKVNINMNVRMQRID